MGGFRLPRMAGLRQVVPVSVLMNLMKFSAPTHSACAAPACRDGRGKLLVLSLAQAACPDCFEPLPKGSIISFHSGRARLTD